MEKEKEGFFSRLEGSLILTLVGIVVLFSGAILITLHAPRFIDKSWTSPTSYYQVQMYEVADPHFFISSKTTGSGELQFVRHLQEGVTLQAFQESDTVKIIAPKDLEKYITRKEDKKLKLTSKLLLLRKKPIASNFQREEKKKSEVLNPDLYELYKPEGKEAFVLSYGDGVTESFIDRDFEIIDQGSASFQNDPGVVYSKNPVEYRFSKFKRGAKEGWRYDPLGRSVSNLEELESASLGFRSRKELIAFGEHLFAIEGCWYCHTDQTRTLIQDIVANGSESYPAPPSSANEYIYQKTTFPGTRRIGPDLSRVGVKRPSRDWHKSHFWSPKTVSKGSIMPSFRHFFDNDPSGTAQTEVGVPNHLFEAIFQYLMTKGTRIDPPTEAWWLGQDPIQTLEVIEGRKKP